MAFVGFIGDPADKAVGSKISLISLVNEQGQPIKTYFSYRLYVAELYQATQENLRDRFKQGLGSHLTWEDELASRNNLPAGSCRGLYIVSLDRDKISKIAEDPDCQEALRDPLSYISLIVTEGRDCIQAQLRQPSWVGLTKVIDLLALTKN